MYMYFTADPGPNEWTNGKMSGRTDGRDEMYMRADEMGTCSWSLVGPGKISSIQRTCTAAEWDGMYASQKVNVDRIFTVLVLLI